MPKTAECDCMHIQGVSFIARIVRQNALLLNQHGNSDLSGWYFQSSSVVNLGNNDPLCCLKLVNQALKGQRNRPERLRHRLGEHIDQLAGDQHRFCPKNDAGKHHG